MSLMTYFKDEVDCNAWTWTDENNPDFQVQFFQSSVAKETLESRVHQPRSLFPSLYSTFCQVFPKLLIYSKNPHFIQSRIAKVCPSVCLSPETICLSKLCLSAIMPVSYLVCFATFKPYFFYISLQNGCLLFSDIGKLVTISHVIRKGLFYLFMS